jgi:hypothetical protein
MTLDNPAQKQFLLELINQVQFPGAVLDMAFETKQAVANAKVVSPLDQRLAAAEYMARASD